MQKKTFTFLSANVLANKHYEIEEIIALTTAKIVSSYPNFTKNPNEEKVLIEQIWNWIFEIQKKMVRAAPFKKRSVINTEIMINLGEANVGDRYLLEKASAFALILNNTQKKWEFISKQGTNVYLHGIFNY